MAFDFEQSQGYTAGQKHMFGSFLLDGRIPVSNSLDKTAIRLFAVICRAEQSARCVSQPYRNDKASGLDMYVSWKPQV